MTETGGGDDILKIVQTSQQIISVDSYPDEKER